MINVAVADLVCGDEVPDEQEDAHHDVLCDGNDVGTGDFHDFETLLCSYVEVDVVRPDTGGHAELEVLGLRCRQARGLHEVGLGMTGNVPSQLDHG